jgi:3-mercaptopyruvate sulfurtransferase SseA
LLVDDLVPGRTARVVWCDDGDGAALLAARRMAALGYRDVAVLDGGIAAWEAAGYRLYSGVQTKWRLTTTTASGSSRSPRLSRG